MLLAHCWLTCGRVGVLTTEAELVRRGTDCSSCAPRRLRWWLRPAWSPSTAAPSRWPCIWRHSPLRSCLSSKVLEIEIHPRSSNAAFQCAASLCPWSPARLPGRSAESIRTSACPRAGASCGACCGACYGASYGACYGASYYACCGACCAASERLAGLLPQTLLTNERRLCACRVAGRVPATNPPPAGERRGCGGRACFPLFRHPGAAPTPPLLGVQRNRPTALRFPRECEA